MPSDLNVSVADRVAIVEMCRGPANHFDEDLIRRVAEAIEEVQQDRSARAVVLCSSGKHFCAGADFGASSVRDDRERAAAALYQEGVRLLDAKLPIVAAVQGAAVGGGFGLACMADFRVASQATRFHANFSALGFHHGFGLTATLPRIVGPQRAADLLLTARRIDGAEAFRLGLVDRLAEAGSERAAALALGAELAARAPLAVESIRQTLRGSLAEEVRSVLERELDEQRRLWRTRDSEAGINASLARTIPDFVGE
jgi:2-(1,2-epoxy-1,2-dihydrophenyl)acetyl-CoA isomerase